MDPTLTPSSPEFFSGNQENVPVSSPAPEFSTSFDAQSLPEKSNKKKIIIIIAIFAAIIAMIGIVFIATKNIQSNNQNSELRTAYSKYANFLLYDKTSDENFIEEFDEYKIYYPLELINASDEETKAFYTEAGDLLAKYGEIYSKKYGENNIGMSVINYHKNQLNSFMEHGTVLDEPSDDSEADKIDSIDLIIRQCFNLRNYIENDNEQ